MMERILIVEDEDPIRELIRLHLTMAGYEPLEAANGIEALEIIGNSKLDLVLLDIMLPGIDGYSLLPEITKRDISVIMLTAKDALIDKVQGFELGADDYLTKPFQAVELLARIKAVLRRSKKAISCLYYDDITLYLDQHQVFKNNLEIDLTFKEFELLRLLIENKGLVMSREKLLQLVWDYDYEGNTRTVDMHIKRLREKLATDKITTVYKVGYRLEA